MSEKLIEATLSAPILNRCSTDDTTRPKMRRDQDDASGAQPSSGHIRRRSSFRSLRSFVRAKSRSLSRTRWRGKQDAADESANADRSLSRKGNFFRRHVATDPPPRSGQDFFMTTALPRVEPQTRLSTDLANFTTRVVDEPHLQSHDGRETRVLRRQTRKLSHDPSKVMPITTLLNESDDPYSESVADWNIVESHRRHSHAHAHGRLSYQTVYVENPDDIKTPPGFGDHEDRNAHYSQTGAIPPRRLSHKPDLDDLKDLLPECRSPNIIARQEPVVGSTVPERRRISRSSLHKPLPKLPLDADCLPFEHHANIDSTAGRTRGYLVRDAKNSIDLKAYLRLNNTEETHLDVSWSPAVTKDRQTVNTHEIIRQAITREIHNHHYHHRILPVVDIEVLPPRHFVPAEGGGYTEIAEGDIPGGGNNEELQQLVKNAVANLMPRDENTSAPRQFTARTFEGVEGDFDQHTTPDGVQHTEHWWVHPPTAEDGGRRAGQTLPFCFGSSPWADATRDRVPVDTSSPHKQSSIVASENELLSERPEIRTILPVRMVHTDT